MLGALFALGAPLGFVGVRAISQRAWPTLAWLAQELEALSVEYAYLTLSTVLVMASFGRILGIRDDRLEESAATDPLTGLWNRRQLSLRLREEVARAVRHGSSLALLMVDVDDLKPINDDHGHEAGDAALRRVGAVIQDHSRIDDVAARWGGDEFAVLVPGAGARDAAELAERVCAAVRASGLSVSIGVAELGDRKTAAGLALCRAADEALYRAKQGGRGRVVIASSISGPGNRR